MSFINLSGNFVGDHLSGVIQSGSFSQFELKPIAFRSISGKAAKIESSLSLKSLLGEIMSRKYLMMLIL